MYSCYILPGITELNNKIVSNWIAISQLYWQKK